MNILAIDTMTEYCSVALRVEHEIFSETLHCPRQHVQHVLPIIDHLLSTHGLTVADISSILVNAGPGSFVGGRIGAAIAKGLALAHDIPVACLSTLHCYAQALFMETKYSDICVVNNAYSNELYIGYYTLGEDDIMQPFQADALIKNTELDFLTEKKWLVTGDVFVQFPEIKTLCRKYGFDIHDLPKNSAEHVVMLQSYAEQNHLLCSSDEAQPYYLRSASHWQ